MEMLIEAMKRFKTGKLIFDNRKAGALLPADQEWAFTDWHSRALAAGHTHVAIIQSPDIFSQISAIDVLSHVAIPTAFFDNTEDAITWMSDFFNIPFIRNVAANTDIYYPQRRFALCRIP